ncbi:hypothetical protein [Pectobacterium aroidearum]|uniref:hypothetical protein n=1 Tax=Pectobacterium aroidearum TaxID=1201031 RepID=UPI002113D249|nr:hypothetical protein [Pectobacterium aroidearum]UUE58408.1 hypothetical protein L0Y27_03665 [Pectobacterium aroidearum]UUE71528.1 hypothetical protein L0Y21_05920 [Pectobacterium aroidearum]UUE75928.1 hypothetical protein L0Y20_06035 [Pectobacterium aroidearum]UUE79819.1 hypothetical protein L0Y24_03665 [Pectobacterium aroidearum]
MKMLLKEHGSQCFYTLVDHFNDSPKKCISMLVSIVGDNGIVEKQAQANFEARSVDEVIERLSITFDFENEEIKEEVKKMFMKFFTK